MSRFSAVVSGCCLAAALAAFAPAAPALAGAHYTSGLEGLKTGTLPPPGFYWKVYSAFYTADSMRTNSGNKAPGDFDLDMFALVNRFIWTTDVKILGADLAMDIIIPTTYTHIRTNGDGFHKTGLGDILIEPFLLGWHGKRYDLYAGPCLWIPTGNYDVDNPTSPGKGFWTVMLSGGGTYYFDDERSWHAGISMRYEIHTRQRDTHQTHGNEFSFEWGLGKTVGNTDFGIAGFCHWQVTDNSGRGADDLRKRSYGIGPEISTTIPDWNLTVGLAPCGSSAPTTGSRATSPPCFWCMRSDPAPAARFAPRPELPLDRSSANGV